MGRLAGRFAMVKQLSDLGLLGPDTTYIHCCYFSEEEWQLVADSGGTISIAAQVETQMGHGWPPIMKAIEYGLRPSLSIDVVTTVPGDMFTQIRAGFAADFYHELMRTLCGLEVGGDEPLRKAVATTRGSWASSRWSS